MTVTYLVILGLTFLVGLFTGGWLAWLGWQKDVRELAAVKLAREEFLLGIAASEREINASERRELYSRIQAYDPNVGDFEPPSITRPPSRPGEEVRAERAHTEEELGQMGLVQQADGMIRDTRSDALFETVEDWRFWQADLKKRNLPPNVHPQAVQELGWQGAAELAREETVQRKSIQKN